MISAAKADGDEPTPPTTGGATPAWVLVGVRYVIPAVTFVGGVVVMALGGSSNLEGGAGIISAGVAVLFLNWLYRLGVEGDHERETEEAARRYFDRYGRWPDDGSRPPSAPAAGSEPAAARVSGPAAHPPVRISRPSYPQRPRR